MAEQLLSSELQNLTQAQLAQVLGCERTRINADQHKGMPFKRGGRGRANRYDGPVCLFWRNGMSFLKARKIPLLPAPTVVILGYLNTLESEPPDFWHPRAVELAVRAGAKKSEATTVIDRALNVMGRPR